MPLVRTSDHFFVAMQLKSLYFVHPKHARACEATITARSLLCPSSQNGRPRACGR